MTKYRTKKIEFGIIVWAVCVRSQQSRIQSNSLCFRRYQNKNVKLFWFGRIQRKIELVPARVSVSDTVVVVVVVVNGFREYFASRNDFICCAKNIICGQALDIFFCAKKQLCFRLISSNCLFFRSKYPPLLGIHIKIGLQSSKGPNLI